jgi:hypothetical protein
MKRFNFKPILVILLLLVESPFAYAMGAPSRGGQGAQIWSFLPAVLIFIVVILIIFLICRELFCWYWKINKMTALLTDIRNLLQKQSGDKDIFSKTTESKPRKG